MRSNPVRCGRAAVLVTATTAMLVVTACSSGSGGPAQSTESARTSAPPPANTHVVAHVGGAVELAARSSGAPAADPAALGAVAKAEQGFSVALLHQLASAGGDNVSVSPASLAIALAMLQNGAAGQTLDQIARALSPDLSTAEQNAGWAALTAQWQQAAKDGGFALQSANGVWVQKGLPVQAPFMSALSRYFGSGVWQVDYQNRLAEAVDAINTWTSQQTHGKIPKLFDQLDPNTALVLANAVYFKAAWQQPFDPTETKPGSFTLDDGSSAQAKFMSEDLGNLPAAVTDAYEAVQLPYKGGRFAALAVMPKSGTLADFVKNLTASSLAQLTGGLSQQQVSLRMPRFTTTSTLDLPSTLNALGINDAFTDHADFSALSPQHLVVTKALQRVYLSVGEKGTEAAAATGIGMGITAVPAQQQEINLDHPFLFLIRDTKTGAILFATEVQNPSAS